MSTRKVAFALAGTATGALLLIGAKGAESDSPSGPTTAAVRQADVSSVPAPSSSPVIGDYTVTGTVVQTPFGPVRVKATIVDGRIEDMTALETPTEHAFSIELNRFATPILRKETLAAQSAKIDVVSGATYTSDAYAQSLQAALVSAAAGKRD